MSTDFSKGWGYLLGLSEVTEIDRLGRRAHSFEVANPYETPKSDLGDGSSHNQPSWPPKGTVKEFFSLSGSFSRLELLTATGMIMGIELIFELLNAWIPAVFTDTVYLIAVISLYPIWGVALGKRSRDLGTTFTYGMVVGMILPFIIGLIFLFQAGDKSRQHRQNEVGSV